MLVLSRKKNEKIRINHDIEITVVEIRGDKIRLGIVAPADITVHRQEVYDLIFPRKKTDASSTEATHRTTPAAG
jgi:carbon storage regulator